MVRFALDLNFHFLPGIPYSPRDSYRPRQNKARVTWRALPGNAREHKMNRCLPLYIIRFLSSSQRTRIKVQIKQL